MHMPSEKINHFVRLIYIIGGMSRIFLLRGVLIFILFPLLVSSSLITDSQVTTIAPQGNLSSRSKELNSEQLQRIEQAAEVFGLLEVDKKYLAELWRQQLYPSQKKLKIVSDRNRKAPDENFILASMLSDDERTRLLKSIEYEELVKDPGNAEAAKETVVTLNNMDGGIGVGVDRKKLIAKRTGVAVDQVELAAKGTDLGFEVEINGEEVFISIAEAKILQVIKVAQANKYAKVQFQPLVNWQSKLSYEKLLDGTIYLYDRLNPDVGKRSYRQIMEASGIEILPMREQADLPGIEKETRNPTLNPKGLRQPGGHGQWGFLFFYELSKTVLSQGKQIHIRVFCNGDNLNSRLNEHIAGYMARNKIPLIKLTTAATPIDKKGGKDGVRLEHVGYVPDQMEGRDAFNVGQTEEFEGAGLPGGLGEAGKQPFNTNIMYFNETILHEILSELKTVIGEKKLYKVFSPTLIDKPATTVDNADYIPIDGAIGTALHNLNAYFQLSRNLRVRRILTKRNLDRLLYFVNVPRTEFFTPIKFASDMWLQSHSDYYNFNAEEMILEDAESGRTLPEFNLKSKDKNGEDDKYWNEVQHLIDALGRASTKGLKSLSIKGQIQLVDHESDQPQLIGEVEIINETGRLVNLTDYRQGPLSELFRQGPLVLRNVSITLNKNRDDGSIDISVSSIREAEAMNEPPQEALAIVETSL